MALGKRVLKQGEMFVPLVNLPKSPAHPFYSRLNELLAEDGFDAFVEELCAEHYKDGGRPSIPPGVYFRMLFIGFFEGIDSQRGIAWRCADSRSLRDFLGASSTDTTPAHNSMTVIRQRLPAKAFETVFDRVLAILGRHGLLKGKTLGIDATTLEANAAMKGIVRKADGKDWNEYLRALAKAEGVENPTDDDLRRIDRGRKDKKVSNEDWESPTDGDARIARMKDGRTRLAYKAEHAVDLETEAIVNAHVTHANRSDSETVMESVVLAQGALVNAANPETIQEVVADKGYHDNRVLAACAAMGIRTYIPERRQASRVWTNKPEEMERAFRSNRRRVTGARGHRLSRWRSERVERTFAHVCGTGGGRRSWLRGMENVHKAHLMRCCGYNLALVMRKSFGMAKPRSGPAAAAVALVMGMCLAVIATKATEASWGAPGLIWYAVALLLVWHMAANTTESGNFGSSENRGS